MFNSDPNMNNYTLLLTNTHFYSICHYINVSVSFSPIMLLEVCKSILSEL